MIKLTLTTENLNEVLMEHNIRFPFDEKTDPDIITMKKSSIGEVEIRNKHISGINLMECKAEFSQPTRIYEDMNNTGNIFSLYFNLGNTLKTQFSDSEMQIAAKSQNIWSFAGDEKAYMNYLEREKSHSFSIVLEENYLHDIVNRYPDLLTELYLCHQKHVFRRWNKRDMPINHEVNQILSQIQNADVMGKYSSAYIEAKVLELLVLQLCCPNQHTCCLRKFCKHSGDIDRMHEARHILLQNIEKPPSIYELSRQVGVNDKKLKNGFKEVFNQTIYSCLFEHKMERARKLLLETNKTIFEIGCECGYDYASHFTTAFKRRFGMSPKTFRGEI